MGLVQSSFASITEASSKKSLRAHKLHLALRAWSDVEVWSAFRRVRKLYPNVNTLTLSQTAEVLSLDDSHLLFIWDFASEDDQTVDLRFLLTTVCLFSGCPLNEKGRFLLCLFDRSVRGVITCQELALIAFTIVHVLEKCFVLPASSKEAVLSVRRALAEYLPSLQEILANDESFAKEQVVGASDMNVLLAAIKPVYSATPFAEVKFAIRNRRTQLRAETTAGPDVASITRHILNENSQVESKPATPVTYAPNISFAKAKSPDTLFNRDTEIAQLRNELNRANALIKALHSDDHNKNCCLLKSCPNYKDIKSCAQQTDQTAQPIMERPQTV
jgi:hypothetical protein